MNPLIYFSLATGAVVTGVVVVYRWYYNSNPIEPEQSVTDVANVDEDVGRSSVFFPTVNDDFEDVAQFPIDFDDVYYDCSAEVDFPPFEDVHDVEGFYSEHGENDEDDMDDFNQEYLYPTACQKSDESSSKFPHRPQQQPYPSKSKDKKKKKKAVAFVPSKRLESEDNLLDDMEYDVDDRFQEDFSLTKVGGARGKQMNSNEKAKIWKQKKAARDAEKVRKDREREEENGLKKAKVLKNNKAAKDVAINEATLVLFEKLRESNILACVNGVICTGKESVVVHANGCKDTDFTIPNECAIKVFKIATKQPKGRDQYIKEDYRFQKRYKGKAGSSKNIRLWAEKEMHNLNRLHQAGIPCPVPITLKDHILVMSFVGHDGTPAPKLVDIASSLDSDELYSAFNQVISSMFTLFNECNLIHCDLSEYNILYYNDTCYIVDVSQAVECSHPNAAKYLFQDCTNVVNFFRRMGLSHDISKPKELFDYVRKGKLQDAAAPLQCSY